MMTEEKIHKLRLTVKIVKAYSANNHLTPVSLQKLILDTFESVHRAYSKTEIAETHKEPAVPIRNSIKPDYLVCLESGKKFKMLKKHLRTSYNMSPQQYRERWNLPASYPMVAPNYSKNARQ